MSSANPYLDERRCLVDQALSRAVPESDPAELYVPAAYALSGSGKRLRPLLVVLAAEASGADPREALPAAVAVELLHTFTLVHDDIMDRADVRRGRATLHVRWDVSTAILAGDLLFALAYAHLASIRGDRLPAVLSSFTRAVARICEGQAMDMAFAARRTVTVDEYLDMIDRKTGALLACALELGGLVAGADAATIETLRAVGGDIGRAFQIQDDLLDLVARSEAWGKSVGGDLVEGKRTFPLLRALERSAACPGSVGPDEVRLLERVMEGGVTPDVVPAVRGLMQRLGVLKDSRDAVIFRSDAALGRLATLPASRARDALVELVQGMRDRDC